MENNKDNSSDMIVTSCRKLIIESIPEIKNFDKVKNKKILCDKIAKKDIQFKETAKLYIDIIKKESLKNKNISDLYKNLKKKSFNYKQRENYTDDFFIDIDKKNNIIVNCKKFNNLTYAKINIYNWKNFTEDYLLNQNNSIDFKKLIINNNLNKQNLLSKWFFEYNSDNNISFYSNFEMGNLLYVYQNIDNKNEFDIILSSDINTNKNIDWFYFKVVGSKKGDKIKINIINLIQKNTLIENNLIAIKSVTLESENKEIILSNWKYYKDIIYFKKHNDLSYFYLTFEYTFKYDNEVTYFSKNIPYSTSRIDNFLFKIINLKNDRMYFK